MSEFSACRFLITRFLYAGFYCIRVFLSSLESGVPPERVIHTTTSGIFVLPLKKIARSKACRSQCCWFAVSPV